MKLDGQVYIHTDKDGVKRCFSVPFLERHRQENPTYWELASIDIDRATMRLFLQERGVDMARARAISLARMEDPGIACWMPDGTGLVVDGSHRLVKRVLQGRKTMELWMCQEEVWSQSLIDANSHRS
jgi:hypothetical protein